MLVFRSQKLRLAGLLAVACACHLPTSARAEFLFNGFIAPAASLNADRNAWDILYAPYNGQNYPDIRAPYGAKQNASSAGFMPPGNSMPSDPIAYFDTRNATLTQTGEPNAFIIGPSTAGNIYSFSGPTAYRVDNSTTAYASPYDVATVSFQFMAAGTLIDFSAIRLRYTDAANVVRTLAANEVLREYQGSTGSPFGGLNNRTALQWNLAGLGIRTYQIVFNSTGSSNSFQLATMATSAIAGEIVPTSRIWVATGSGNWTGGFRDPQGAPGNSPNANGNVRFANPAATSTVLDADYTVGEVRFDTAAAIGISTTGGNTLTVNTGITSTAAATGIYTFGANYQLGAFNIFDLAAGDVRVIGPVSGPYGLEKDGVGSLMLGGNNSFTGSVTVDAGTLTISGTNTYTAATEVAGGTLVIARGGSLADGPVTVESGAAFVNDGTVAGNVEVRGSLGGAGTFSGAVTFQSTASFASAGTFTGGFTVNQGSTLALSGGTTVARGAVLNNGTLRFTKGATFDARGATSITNNGTLDFLSGNLILPPNVTINNGPNGRVLTADLLKVRNTLSRTSTQVTVRCDGYAAHTYQLQKSSTLPGASYVNVGSPQTVTVNTSPATPLSFDDFSPNSVRGFYRVRVDP